MIGMRLALAESRASLAATQLQEVAARVEIVGSVRRRRPVCKDIELLVEPRMRTADLFGGEAPDLEPIRQVVHRWGEEVVLDGDRLIRVVSGRGDAGRVQWEVFLVHPPATWGALMAIRTGPADFSRWCVTRLRRRGMRCSGGAVYRTDEAGEPTGEPLPTPTEREFFELCGVEYRPPEVRGLAAVGR